MTTEELAAALGADVVIPQGFHRFDPSKVNYDRCKICYEADGHLVHNMTAANLARLVSP